MKAKAPFMITAQSSGSSFSAIEVERATSANSTVANFRSPSIDRGGASDEPQLLQKRASSGLTARQFAHVTIVGSTSLNPPGQQRSKGQKPAYAGFPGRSSKPAQPSSACDAAVADECVSALDVSVQSSILNLLLEQQRQLGLSYVFISHDLSVVHHMSDRMIVMKSGRIVEAGRPSEIMRNPQDPYTRELIASVPGARSGERTSRSDRFLPTAGADAR
jgi:hypothetical protein